MSAKPRATGTLIFEIGTEELPAGAIDLAVAQLTEMAPGLFAEFRLAPAKSLRVWATPRRLAVMAELPAVQAEKLTTVTGPPAVAGYDADGKPTQAAIGFARGQGVAVEDLEIVETGRGQYIGYQKKEVGKPAGQVLVELLPRFVDGLNFPKTMHWDTGVRFPRPIRWLLAMFDRQIVQFELGKLTSGNVTYGHRLLTPAPAKLAAAGDYPKLMKRLKVEVDQAARRRSILKQIDRVVGEGARVVMDGETFEEVVNLVESPHAVLADFAPEFLKVPREVLVAAMEEHQRYFPVENARGKLAPNFVVVHNGDQNNKDIIKRGHERVIGSRLADARFFFREDQKVALADRLDRLKHIVWHGKLGTLYDKTERVQKLATKLAEETGPDAQAKGTGSDARAIGTGSDALAKQAARAARLSKTDLTTDVVIEFTSLQGVMGGVYAGLQGESKEVAQAIREQYLPRTVDDPIPKSAAGRIVSLADKFDSIVGGWLAGLIPSGSQDPYSLRRQAQGIVRIVLEAKLPALSIARSTNEALKLYEGQGRKPEDRKQMLQELADFFTARLRNYFLARGFGYDEIDAVLAVAGDDPLDAQARIKTLHAMRKNPALADAELAFTRLQNLSDAAAGKAVSEKAFEQAEERSLYKSAARTRQKVDGLVAKGDYKASVEELARLRPVVDKFFDAVLVMAEKKGVRKNRLALLNFVLEPYLAVADFSKLVTPGQTKG